MSAAHPSGGPRLHRAPLRGSATNLSPAASPQSSPQPHSPSSPLSPLSEAQSPSATASYQALPIEYPPGMAPPRSRVRRSSVSAESDRPITLHPRQRKVVSKSGEQRARIRGACKSSILFSGLDREQQEEIIDCMDEVKLRAGEVVIRQGEEGDFFYIIDSGVFDVYRTTTSLPPSSSSSAAPSPSPALSPSSIPLSSAFTPLRPSSTSSSTPASPSPPPGEEKVFEYHNRGSFGELALMYNCPRAATVQARTDGCLWRVDRETFRHIVIASTARKRKLLEGALEEVPLLANLSKQERAHVADAMETVTHERRGIVIRQGEVGESMFFVIRGECVATQAVEGRGEVEVGRIRDGGYFGERSLLTNDPRAANVVCVSERVELGQLDRSAFERLLGSVKDVMHRQMAEYKRADEIPHAETPEVKEGEDGDDNKE